MSIEPIDHFLPAANNTDAEDASPNDDDSNSNDSNN